MATLQIKTRMAISGDSRQARFIPSFSESSKVFRIYGSHHKVAMSDENIESSMQVGAFITKLLSSDIISFTRKMDAFSMDIFTAKRETSWIFIGFEFSIGTARSDSTTLTLPAAGISLYFPHDPGNQSKSSATENADSWDVHNQIESNKEYIGLMFNADSAKVNYGATLNDVFVSRAEAALAKAGGQIAQNLRQGFNNSVIGALLN